MRSKVTKPRPPVNGKRPASRLVAGSLMALIRLYQLTFSSVMGRTCRHLPTCSDYAREAIGRHGPWRGFWLGLSRVLRCRPWGSEGFDPVPADVPDHGWRFWRYGRWRGANGERRP